MVIITVSIIPALKIILTGVDLIAAEVLAIRCLPGVDYPALYTTSILAAVSLPHA
jgi:hypothetical protein